MIEQKPGDILFPNKQKLDEYLATHLEEMRGRVVQLLVLHDDACEPNNCRCEPEFILREGTVENMVEGVRETRKWIRSKQS